jgi:hypothetical protein
MHTRLDYAKASPDAYKAMLAVESYPRHCGLAPTLLDLVDIRSCLEQ